MQIPKLPRADSYLAHYARTQPDIDAWIDSERRISYANAHAWVDQISRALLAAGLLQGERVAVYGKPSADFMALFLAISSVGCIYVGLNPKYTERELSVIVDDCEPVLVFNLLDADPEHAQKVNDLASRHGTMRCVPAIALPSFLLEGESVPTARLEEARATVQPKDVALLVYTSGTTGLPKGAQLTHRGVTFIGPITSDPTHFGVQGPGRTLCNLPINHVGCVVDICTNNLIAGATLVFQPDFDPVAMLTAIEEHKLTSIGGVPVMFLALANTSQFQSTDYSSLQKVILAGNPPPMPLVQLLQKVMKCAVFNGYGLTEAMGFSTFTQAEDSAEVVAGTVGQFAPQIEWRIADGEIQMRGDWLFAGYFRRPEATAEAFTEDGWFKTGDLAEVTPQQNIRLVGRSKEMFKSGGYNVYPLEIEQALESIEGVAMAIVVPVPDDSYVEVGYAFVVGHAVTDGSLKAQLRARLANYKIPKHLEVVGTLPMLPIGKVDRIALKNTARDKLAQTRGAVET
ncbi:MAG: class I adenylate-forming enzyme family protein [Ottowia sp.]|uniref:class I adenylate-forming enzyme family protein n=1 Tax=Ottowia sp. TaxID=1898956 RepID=UPI003C722E26